MEAGSLATLAAPPLISYFNMELPPANWNIFEAASFETAPPRTAADVCVEVMAQLRPNGRVMDHWRIATGRTAMLKTTVDLASPNPATATGGLWACFRDQSIPFLVGLWGLLPGLVHPSSGVQLEPADRTSSSLFWGSSGAC